jgi:hypothetical protein
MLWHDFSAELAWEGATLEELVRAAAAEAPPAPTPDVLRKACAEGALALANARVVSVLHRVQKQSVSGARVDESSRTADFVLDHAWTYDCKTGVLERRLTMRFAVVTDGESVAEYVVDRLLERRHAPLK